jgi:hypothetical protein
MPTIAVLMLLGAILVGGKAAVQTHRFGNGPIITPDMLPGADGANINGPSLIRVPSWVTAPLGRYYLYFAHHGGTYIRLACADSLAGPWRIHAGGALALADAPGAQGHIASPDLIIDEDRHELRMYFHGPARGGGGQRTFVATSSDGLRWVAAPTDLGPFYFRVFRWQDAWYAVSKGGDLHRSADGMSPFVLHGNPFSVDVGDRPVYNAGGSIRHLAIDVRDDELWAWYSRIGDAPECILRQRIVLGPDPVSWRAEPAEEMLRPALPWEGTDLPVAPSRAGAVKGREHALRDPAIFREDGRCFLVYSVAGETGLALAEVTGGE